MKECQQSWVANDIRILLSQILTADSVFIPTTAANGKAMTGTFQNGTSFYVRFSPHILLGKSYRTTVDIDT